MDNDDALIGTIWSRRQALKMGLGTLIGGGVAARLIGCSSAVSGNGSRPVLMASPALTEGPFFVDERLNRSDLLAGSTRTAVMNGTPLQMDLTVLRLDASFNATPFKGAQVDVWHCDTLGIYSDEIDPMNAEQTAGQRWLRGYQIVDASGLARFSTIVPGWYEGRTTHIHFKVRQFSQQAKQTAEFTSQLFFPDDTLDWIYRTPPYSGRGKRNMLNTDDGIYNERLKDGLAAGGQQLLHLSNAGPDRYKTQFTIVVSDASLHDNTRHDPGRPGFGPPPNGGFGPPPDDGFGPPPWWLQ